MKWADIRRLHVAKTANNYFHLHIFTCLRVIKHFNRMLGYNIRKIECGLFAHEYVHFTSKTKYHFQIERPMFLPIS